MALNLDEVLRGIGSQMSKALPSWTDYLPQPSAQQDQPGNWSDYLGSFGQHAAQSSWADYLRPNPGAQQSGSWGDLLHNDPSAAMGHVQAAQQMPTAQNYQKGTAAGNNDEVDQYIRQAFAKRGHDPNIASTVFHGEGAPGYVGDYGSSFGPFQLHLKGLASGGNAGAGLGDEFTRQTGLDPRDPSTWRAQVDWVADNLANTGWGPWHGAAKQGITGKMGVGTFRGNTETPADAADRQSFMSNPLSKAQPFMGSAYHWGGKSPQTGFDCSGLAGYLTTGQSESTRTLYAKSQAIDPSQAQPGDLVFYNMGANAGAANEHVAVSIGNGQIVQAGGTQHNVNVSNANQFSAPGWQPEYRRLTGGATGSAPAPLAQPGYFSGSQWR